LGRHQYGGNEIFDHLVGKEGQYGGGGEKLGRAMKGGNQTFREFEARLIPDVGYLAATFTLEHQGNGDKRLLNGSNEGRTRSLEEKRNAATCYRKKFGSTLDKHVKEKQKVRSNSNQQKTNNMRRPYRQREGIIEAEVTIE